MKTPSDLNGSMTYIKIYTFTVDILGLIWKIYSGSKKSTSQSAAIFVLEKRALEAQYPDKTDREALLEQCRKAVSQLTRLKHPQVLTVQVNIPDISIQLWLNFFNSY